MTFRRAIEGYCEQRRFHRMGIAHLDLGSLFVSTLQLGKARLMFERAVKLLMRSRDGFGLATARRSLGELLSLMRNNEEAHQELQAAREVFHRLDRYDHELLCITGDAEALLRMRQSEKAEQLIEQAIAMAQLHSSVERHRLLAALHLMKGELKLAEQWAQAAVEESRSSGSSLDIANSQAMLGRVYMAQEQG